MFSQSWISRFADRYMQILQSVVLQFYFSGYSDILMKWTIYRLIQFKLRALSCFVRMLKCSKDGFFNVLGTPRRCSLQRDISGPSIIRRQNKERKFPSVSAIRYFPQYHIQSGSFVHSTVSTNKFHPKLTKLTSSDMKNGCKCTWTILLRKNEFPSGTPNFLIAGETLQRSLWNEN